MRAWEGVTASQEYLDANKNPIYALQGGARQIVLDPKDLNQNYVGKRRSTGWGYSNFGEGVDLVGVPVLQNNWYYGDKK